jgi:non-ribosomal peptide synthetase component F/thioesterase domain-containing protein
MSEPANNVFNPSANSPAAAAPVTSQTSTESAAQAERNAFPCSVAQERFWLLDRLDPGNASYNVAVRWRLEGRVSTELLQAAWLKIIERHEILRTVFPEVDGAPVQQVSQNGRFRLNEIDLSGLAADKRQAEGDRIGVLEARAPFDLATGPLIRATLLRFSPTSSIILVTTHQIVSDGWSIGVMAREMGIIYQALRQEQPVPLEPLAIQYADYSLWHLEWLRVRGTEAETTYWTKQLAGVKPFNVAPDRARPTIPTTNGHIVSRVLPRELTNRAQLLTAEHGATLFAAALGSLCATLSRFTGSTEIVIGTQVSDRDQVELEPMIGQFVNSLVLRNDLSGDPTFVEQITRIRDTVAQALDHRHIPIEKLLGMIKAERGHANSPPISVNFIFQKTFIQNTNYGEFDLIDMPSLPAGAIYDLNFFMVERPDGWRFSCQFNTDQFEAATAERLLGYVQNVLESGVADPSRRLPDLNVSPPGEARLLLDKLNDTRTLYPRDLTLAKLFEVQAARLPDAVAVICGDRQLSYAEVDAAANQAAEYLRLHGISAGARVGVCLPPTVDLPVILLGVMRAGGTFLLLDPADPVVRRDESSAAAGLTAIIGHGFRLSEHLRDSIRAIAVEPLLAHRSKSSSELSAARDVDSAACLVMAARNDGSAGAVSLSHRNLSNLIYSLAKRPGVGDRDVVMSIAPLSIDCAPFEIFLPLLTGARLVLANARDLATGRALLNVLQRTSATIMYGNASVWRTLLEAGWVGYPSLKMLCGVSELTGSLQDQLAGMSGELWALYGHSAATLCSATVRLKSKQPTLSVGTPIANTSLYVFDGKRQLAPVGATGTLYIGGDGLTSSDGTVSIGGTPFLATGDLARLRAEGQIEYLGRADERFLLQGRLTHPAEIERILNRHPKIAESAALCGGGPGEHVLTAHIVPREMPQNTPFNSASLRDWLANNLPANLLPSEIIVHEALPHSGDGKVDRTALRLLKPASRSTVSLPPTEFEGRLAEVWKSMLKVDSIGAADNFFELGGHSLLAARMLTRVEREFGRRIKLATLFSAPTLREFASLLAQDELREFDFRQIVKVQPHGTKPPIIAVNNTGSYYLLAKYLGPDQPFTSLQLFDPSVKNAHMPQTLEEVAAGYVELIRRVQPAGPYSVMGWCVAGALAFEIARQLRAADLEVANLYLMDSWLPKYIARQPPLRRFISNYSLRWQLLLQDWRRMRAGQQSWSTFLDNRISLQRVLGIWKRKRPKAWATSESDAIDFTREDYDLWLLRYLQALTNAYEPRDYDGRLTLFRSKLEPTGWLFDPLAGWGKYARQGVELSMVAGDHHTMFQDPGAGQMGEIISARTLPTQIELPM